MTRQWLFSLLAISLSTSAIVRAQSSTQITTPNVLDWSRDRPGVKVQVLGQVRNPGMYAVYAYDRLANAVNVAGGPNEQASIRSVILQRKNRKADTLDLYKYLVNNQQDQNPEVQDGDIIFFPLAGNVVTIIGQVLRPGKYEVKQSERLMDVVVMAGGFTVVATREDIKIQNINRPDSIINIGIKRFYYDRDPALNVVMHSGDVVTVPMMPTTVTVVGQVQKGGTFPYEPGTLLSYYIGMAGGYAERASAGNIRINRWGGKTVKGRESSIMEPGDVVVVGEMQIKGWRDYINLISQVATTAFIVWQVARVQ